MEQSPVKGAVSTAKGSVKTVRVVKKILALFNVKFLLIALAILLLIAAVAAIAGTSGSKSGSFSGSTGMNLSEATLQWKETVEKEAKEQGVEDLVPYILAIIQVETGGEGNDVMQSSESTGNGKGSITNPKASIKQGVKYLAGIKANAEALGLTDPWAMVQSYNFGGNYVTYLANHKEEHSTDVAEKYSKDVVAPSLGNTLGATYSYINAVSQAKGKTYLYNNGGNYYYADLVRQYVASGSAEIPVGDDVFKTVMDEAIKYIGWSYSWGGYTPSMGFDCSGLVQYAFGKAGITLPRVATQQWAATEKIDIKDAKPGDLVFFKGTYGTPDHISHVGIYVDETRMYDSNGSGIGYHYWTDSYWSSHFDSIRRVVK
ncbi:lysozyme family protein (plasmid) [Niallia taxi]|uniref:Lysozyme n=3 Tax=Bacillati TaxID=1783272 RepID=A0A437K3Z2_9BACI|nr:bifunctional lytic transglycosylase/C40 family peptidase [Niallia taxi]MDK8643284.1 bifunctional lytic transglycosylase/C40 family peptidase [Niallia taxi]MED4057627.1 bifunctional lytic transglycosylase/C40 family peptidase [Niallia taxi]RVT57006.1 lysozyme [Niallia taxi]